MITADDLTLLRQASSTAMEYFHEAIEVIDKRFHEGYAEEHPELISKFMEVAARDFNTSITLKTIEEQTKRFLEEVEHIILRNT